MKYTIEQINKNNLKTVSTFLNKIFSNNSFSEKNLLWKYFENPAGNSLLLGAFHNNKIIGFRAVVPWAFKINNTVKILYQFCEASTDSEYRGQHIFTNLTSEAMNVLKNEVFFNFPHEGNSYFAYKKSFNSKKIDEFRYLIIPFFIFKRQVQIDFRQNCFFHINDFNINRTNETNFMLFLDNMQSYNQSHKTILPKRSTKFINWRFINNPTKKYHFISISESNKNVGYIILGFRKIKKQNIPIIIEVFKNSDYNFNIFKYLKIYSSFLGINYIFYPVLNNRIKEQNLQYRYLKIFKKRINLVITANSYENMEIYTNPTNWDINLTEVDTF